MKYEYDDTKAVHYYQQAPGIWISRKRFWKAIVGLVVGGAVAWGLLWWLVRGFINLIMGQ